MISHPIHGAGAAGGLGAGNTPEQKLRIQLEGHDIIDSSSFVNST